MWGGLGARPRPALTLEGGDERLGVLDELLDELVGLLQLGLVRAEPLPELRAVQAALAELQRRQPHGAAARTGGDGVITKNNNNTKNTRITPKSNSGCNRGSAHACSGAGQGRAEAGGRGAGAGAGGVPEPLGGRRPG